MYLGKAELNIMSTLFIFGGTQPKEVAFCKLDGIYSFNNPKLVFHRDPMAENSPQRS